MTGYRSKECYVEKYGEMVGKEKYEKMVQGRKMRERRANSNRKIILGDDLEKEVELGNAVKCLECGYIGTTLQWTHFKNKCSDNINSIAEYKTKYANAKTVSSNLNKMMSVTLETMVSLYGEDDGRKKFDEYRSKQAETNTFEYKQKKYGMTKDEFDQYNKSRSVTLDNLVLRHGREIGLQKWEDYCERQRYTTTKSYFVEEYGDEEGSRKYNNFEAAKISHGISSKPEREIYEILKLKFPDLSSQVVLEGRSAYDMGLVSKKKLIEFNGTFWHCDPRIYEEDYINSVNKKTAGFIWNRDSEKIKAASDQGYDVYVVWESDYRKDPEAIICALERWLNDGSN